MNEEPERQGDLSPPAPAPSDAAAGATAPSTARNRGLRSGIPYLLFAVVAAVVTGIVVYLVAGGKSDDSGVDAAAAAILDGFIQQGPSGADITPYAGKFPPDFPRDFPVYGGAKIVASFAVASEDGTSYFAILTTSAKPTQVYDFYLSALDKDPWQVEIARASDEFTAMRFSRPDNADIEGDVTLFDSELDDRTAIFITFQDISATASGGNSDKPFVLGASRPLPPGFPKDIPIYKGKAESVVLDTYFERGGGGLNFLVSFLTKDSQDDVVKFYRDEFTKRGWTVTDSASQANSFSLGIDFNDGQRREISGSVSADSFDEDPDYVRVDLLLQVSSSRRTGN